jgi:hypothetical protein
MGPAKMCGRRREAAAYKRQIVRRRRTSAPTGLRRADAAGRMGSRGQHQRIRTATASISTVPIAKPVGDDV